MDPTIYARLSTDPALAALVDDRIFPVVPSPDTRLPYVVYAKTSTEDVLSLNGPVGLTIYTYQMDFWTLNLDDNLQLAQTVSDRLHGWRENAVQGCFREDDSLQLEDVGFHGTQTYRIFAT